MIKRLFSIALIMSVFIFTQSVHAAPETVVVIVNGNVLQTDTPAVIRNDRTMVPFRALFDALGATQIFWDEPTQTVMGSDGTTTIKLVIGSYDIEVNGKIITMDTPPMIINSRTMVPLSMVSTNLGATVAWNGTDYVATVTKGGVAANTSSSNLNQQNDLFNNISAFNDNNPAQISGHYAIEDLKRNKYVLYLNANGSAELIDINSKDKNTGTYSYSNGSLNLKISVFNSTFTREDIKYNNNNIIFMKDTTSPTGGSTFAMLKIAEDEYNKYKAVE